MAEIDGATPSMVSGLYANGVSDQSPGLIACDLPWVTMLEIDLTPTELHHSSNYTTPRVLFDKGVIDKFTKWKKSDVTPLV